MKKFTPGPWKAGRSDMATIVDGIESKWIYADKKYVAIASGCASDDWDEVMGNAHLIAAAPEMYEALISIENDDGSIPSAIWELRNKALNKARGEE